MDPGGTGPIDAAVRLLDGTSLSALVVGFLLSLLVGVLIARRTSTSPILASLTVFSVVVVAVAMLQMGRAGGGILDRNPFEHLSLGALGRCDTTVGDASALTSNEARLNLFLYVPFGVLATVTFGRPWRVLAIAVGLILALEALQSILDVGVCSSLDIVTNIVGVALAIAATVAIRRIVGRRRSRPLLDESR